MNRDQMIVRLTKSIEKKWDVIIIGGGATGLGIALDSASRGYSTVLVEQSDFAKGTSGNSTKLVHGGVRYLAHGDVFLVNEALAERGRFLRNASHISHDQEFLIPLYSWWDAILYTVGLSFYDWLAGRKSLGRSHYIGRKETITRLPLLNKARLKGAVAYHDGQFDDARMAINLAESAVSFSAIVLNYFKLISFQKNGTGKLQAVNIVDLESGREFTLTAACYINATGVFADSILQLDNPLAKPILRPSQGIHLVLDRSFINSESAIMIPKTSDGRVLFCIPWYDRVILGTTDTPIENVSLEPQALEVEIQFILGTAGLYLEKKPGRNDVLSVFAGLRPLAARSGRNQSTREISRRHKIVISDSGLVSVVGGKWTTYRRMACEALNYAIANSTLSMKKCITKSLKLTASGNSTNSRFIRYGRHAEEIEQLIFDNPSLGLPVNPCFTFCMAELIWSVRNEMPRTIEDLLARRTRALILNAKASLELATLAASLMAAELGFDDDWKQNQIKSYTLLVKKYSLETS